MEILESPPPGRLARKPGLVVTHVVPPSVDLKTGLAPPGRCDRSPAGPFTYIDPSGATLIPGSPTLAPGMATGVPNDPAAANGLAGSRASATNPATAPPIAVVPSLRLAFTGRPPPS